MSRTFRNRNIAPKGIKVCDGKPCIAYDKDGNVYELSNRDEVIILYKRLPFKKGVLETWKRSFFKGVKFPEERRYLKRWRKNLYKQESKESRKQHYKSYRLHCKKLIRKERWDEISPYKKTSGWLTW